MIEDKYTNAFKLIISHLSEECGDGDAHIICEHITKEELADKFDAFLSQENEYTKYNRLKRQPYNQEHKVILFSDLSNENVVFSDAKDTVQVPSWFFLQIKI